MGFISCFVDTSMTLIYGLFGMFLRAYKLKRVIFDRITLNHIHLKWPKVSLEEFKFVEIKGRFLKRITASAFSLELPRAGCLRSLNSVLLVTWVIMGFCAGYEVQ